MNAVFRHLSVRLWMTAFIGTMACIYLLPWWQQAMGVGYLAFPAVVIMGGCFAGIGWVMNHIGMGFLHRHVNEASRWERAGMIAEAEAAFRKAMATFDSFWLSPLLRRGKLQWFSGLMARFYLGQYSDSTFIRILISTHLKHFPQDEAVAEPWLEQLLAHENHLPQEQEAVACVNERLVDHRRIQQLLMQFYLANGRTDFDAMQTYRRVWKQQQPLPKDTLQRLSRLLRNEYILNQWALQIYLEAYESGDQGAIEGIWAAVRWLPVTEESKPLLKASEKILTELDRNKPGQLDEGFKPANAVPRGTDRTPSGKKRESMVKTAPKGLFAGLFKKSRSIIEQLIGSLVNRGVRRTLPWIAVAAALVVAGGAGWRFLKRPATEPQVQVVAEKKIEITEITDPFTIQVAAYLKAQDAQRFVDQLIQKGLDAFWTEATSANRTWYQVKVSHFADRQGAQKYGQELKSKGLIDDFYVANYEHSRRNH